MNDKIDDLFNKIFFFFLVCAIFTLIYINKQTLTFHHQEYEIQSITDGNGSPYNLYSLQIDDDYQNISFLTNSNKNSEIITIQVKSSDKIKLVKGYENTIEYDENENKSLAKNVKITYKN